jgi:omega-hydroxy-beta-dihydromenaquinone-9 sulfotransferase
VQISAQSPQEDEFALLSLGARSPYEALMSPRHLAAALALSDPRDLPPEQAQRWRDTFLYLLQGLALVSGGRPLILKSPPHGYRVATLRELLPDARFILIVRAPERVYESTVRMWRSLFPLYALEPIPSEEDVRRVVLADRPRFEAKLTEGLAGLPEDRLALVRYEDLVERPLPVIGRLYEQLRLGDFSGIERSIQAQLGREDHYRARNASPPEYWLRQVEQQWSEVFDRYRYSVRH